MPRLLWNAVAAAALALSPLAGTALAHNCAQLAQITETSTPPGAAVEDQDEEVAEAE
jgi:hypothetical protein